MFYSLVTFGTIVSNFADLNQQQQSLLIKH